MDILEIEKKLINIYPDKSVDDPNIGELLPDTFHDLVYNGMSRIIGECKVNCADNSIFYEVRYSFWLTLKKYTGNQIWLSQNFEDNKKWLLENNNQISYLVLEFSRVWPGYIISFNSFSLGNGQKSIEFNTLTEPPDDDWRVVYEKINMLLLNIPEMVRFTEEELSITMDSYFHEMINYDDDDNPTIEPATLKLCLF